MTDVRTSVSNGLVIGAGAAGLRASIAAQEAGVDVVVIGKRRRRDAHTVLASGGINAALGTVDAQDTWQQHAADTWVEGYRLSDPATVEIMAREAPDAIAELDAWGCPFARTPDGRLDQRYFLSPSRRCPTTYGHGPQPARRSTPPGGCSSDPARRCSTPPWGRRKVNDDDG